MSNKKYITIFPRENGSGKTMFLSMLDYYFNIENNKNETIELFNDSYIMNNVQNFKMNSKPIIFISSFKNFDEYKEIIKNIYLEKKYLLNKLNFKDKRMFKKIMNGKALFEDYTNSINYLSNYLYKFYNKKALVLIDDFNNSINYFKSIDEYNSIINTIYNIILKTYKSNNIEKIIMTMLRNSSQLLSEDEEKMFYNMFNVKIDNPLHNKSGIKKVKDGKEINFKIGYECIAFNKSEAKEILEKNNLSLDDNYVKNYCSENFDTLSAIFRPSSIINYIYEGGNIKNNPLVDDLMSKLDDTINSLENDKEYK